MRININDELERIWKKAIALYFKVCDLLGITKKGKKIQFQYSVASSRFTLASTLEVFVTVV